MSEQDVTKFADKHTDRQANEKLIAAIRDKSKHGLITCAAAHGLAGKMVVDPAEVGRNIDLAALRLHKCQIGLFGYDGGKGFIKDYQVPEELRAALGEVAVDGRLTCRQAWDVAEKTGLARLKVGSAAEVLGMKIKLCQLGAF